MFRSLVVMIALCLVAGQTHAWLGGKDPIAELSTWLEKQTSSTDPLDNIRAADKVAKDDAPMGAEKLIALRELVMSTKKENIKCTYNELNSLASATTFLHMAKSDPYASPNNQQRYNSLVIDLQRQYLTKCLLQHQKNLIKTINDYNEPAQDIVMDMGTILANAQEEDEEDRYNRMQKSVSLSGHVLHKLDKAAHLSSYDLVNESNLKYWLQLLMKISGRNNLCDSYIGGKCQIQRSSIKALLEDKIMHSCRTIKQDDERLGETMFLAGALVKEMRLEPNMMPYEQGDYVFVIAAGLRICKTMESVNLDSLTDQLAKIAA